MTINVTAPAAVCVVGLIIFCAATPTQIKASKIGFAMLWVGLLAALFALR